jgi:4'-phosphopantetheinyl transferase EntD
MLERAKGSGMSAAFSCDRSGVSLECLQSLFLGRVAIAVATEEMYAAAVSEIEYEAIRGSVAERRREFFAGRAAAKSALRTLGCPVRSIPVNPDRSPAWPAGFTGSITHCRQFCGAVAARQSEILSVGFDAEVAGDLKGDVLELVCGPMEIAKFPSFPPSRDLRWEQIAFSAKEAFYKCHYPVTKRFLDFRDVSVRFDHPMVGGGIGNFIAKASNSDSEFETAGEFGGRWHQHGEIIFAGVTYRSRIGR